MPDRLSSDRWAVAAVIAAAVCCAGPVLLVALGLGAGGTALGAALGNPAVLIPAFLVLTVATALAVGWRRR